MHRGRGVSISVNDMRVMIRPTHHRSLAGNHERGGTFVEPRASMGKKLSKKQQRNQVAAKHLEEQRAATAEGFKGADPAGGAHNPGQCTFTFRALQRRLPGLIVVPLPAAPRAPAALSAASGQSPRALGGFSVQTLASSGARSAMSPSGETSPGRGQVGMNKRMRVRHPAALPASSKKSK